MSIDAPPPVKALRRYLVAGLLLWVPLGITFLVLRFLVLSLIHI